MRGLCPLLFLIKTQVFFSLLLSSYCAFIGPLFSSSPSSTVSLSLSLPLPVLCVALCLFLSTDAIHTIVFTRVHNSLDLRCRVQKDRRFCLLIRPNHEWRGMTDRRRVERTSEFLGKLQFFLSGEGATRRKDDCIQWDFRYQFTFACRCDTSASYNWHFVLSSPSLSLSRLMQSLLPCSFYWTRGHLFITAFIVKMLLLAIIVTFVWVTPLVDAKIEQMSQSSSWHWCACLFAQERRRKKEKREKRRKSKFE